MKNLEIALEVFSVLGEVPSDFKNNKFKFYLTPGWQTASFSPIVLLPGNTLSLNDLKQIEEFFHENPVTNSCIESTPYFNFFKGNDLYDMEILEKNCINEGWTIDPDPLCVNLITTPRPMQEMNGCKIIIENSQEQGISADYEKIIKLNFNKNQEYLKNINNLYEQSQANTYTALLQNDKGCAIGGGSISIHNGLGFLTWGGINEEYRHQGLHSLLLSACQMIAFSHDVKICGLATRNKYIRAKVDSFVEMYICRKKQ